MSGPGEPDFEQLPFLTPIENSDENDPNHRYMAMAIRYAELGRGWVEPNPMVGCVLVKNGAVIGAGYHQRFGEPHAEVNALQNASEDPRGAIAYVTLEPCCHQGKTGPCSKALIDAGVAQVIIGHPDPFPLVDGGGIAELRAAGIEVEVGVLKQHVARQNAGFFSRVQRRRPWVIAKWAMTLDGKIATRTMNSQWISNSDSRQLVHLRRGQVDGIIVGSSTVVHDDPSLTARPPGPRNPIRIVFDSTVKIPQDCQLVRTAKNVPTLLVHDSNRADASKLELIRQQGVELLAANGYVSRIPLVLGKLYERDVTNLVIEGGAGLLGEFFEAEMIDEVNVFIAPRVIGEGISAVGGISIDSMATAIRFQEVSHQRFGDDLFYRAFLSHRATQETDT